MPKLNIRNFKYHLELEGWNLKLQHVLKFYAFIPYFANEYLLLLVLRNCKLVLPFFKIE
jgi:hypothetical protein